MKRFYNNFALMTAVVIGVVACSEADINDSDTGTNTSKTVLYADIPEIQASLAENATDGIDLKWEVNDTFNVYDGATKVGTFICTDINAGRFESTEDLTLTNGATYTAKYNEDVNPSSQNGDEITTLNEACQLEATFVYGNDNEVIFSHTMAIMTFTFTSAERPAKLVFENGSEIYTVYYSEITADENNLYTSHIMINPCEATERTLTFSLYDDSGSVYDTRTNTISYSYETGYRYAVSISELSESDWSGSGTEDTPYQITTIDQLQLLSDNVNAGTNYENVYFLMTDDIDLGGKSNEFTAIGLSYETSFSGTFDGGGYEISGLYINDSESNYQGLFGYTTNATIKNLSVSGSVTVLRSANISSTKTSRSISGAECVGGIIGQAEYTTVSNCHNAVSVSGTEYVGGIIGYAYNSITVSDCSNTGTISGTEYVGGIIGQAYLFMGSTLRGCNNEGSISGTNYSVGGIVGMATALKISNSNNSGKVTGKSSVGGVAGSANEMESEVSDCYNSGNVEGTSNVGGVVGSSSYAVRTSYNIGLVLGTSSVGGVVGSADMASKVSDCYNSGDVEGTSYVGGVVGFANNMESVVSNCYNTKSVKGSEFVGGVVGGSYGSSITGCYNTGSVKCTGSKGSVGGVIGFASNQGGMDCKISICYNTGDVEGNASIGGVVGHSEILIIDCYNTGGILGSKSVIGGVVGSVYGNSVTNCYNEGSIKGSNEESSKVGGIVGSYGLSEVSSDNAIDNCRNTGDIVGYKYVGGVVGDSYTMMEISYSGSVNNSYNEGSVNGSEYVGGVVGNSYCTTINKCYNKGDVNGTKYVGGVVGDNSSYYNELLFEEKLTPVMNCYNTGFVKGSEYVGGVVGNSLYNTENNCYNTGTVDGYRHVGGVVGWNRGYYEEFSINEPRYFPTSKCYNIGLVKGSYNVGGIVGNSYASSYSSCYYDSSVNSNLSGSGRSEFDYSNASKSSTLTSQMKNGSFASTLGIAFKEDSGNINSGYPILTWQ